jgi:hypothetical protein
MNRGQEVRAMQSKRRWLGLRVWVVDANGRKHNGTLWWEDESNVLIRQDGVVGLQVLPKAAEGIRWGYADDSGKTPGTDASA